MTPRFKLLLGALPLSVPLILVGCSDFAMSMDAGGFDSGYSGASEGDRGGSGGDGGDDGDGYEPEEGDDFLALEPASTDAYVFVANPNRDTVTRISVPQLAVITTKVGVNPQVVATTADYATAVTFNQGSDDVSIIASETLDVATVDVRDDYNNMVLSPDGGWVACYHDQGLTEAEGADGGTQSFNEVSFVRLGDASHHPMVVGFNPREIQFTRDGALAVVVSDAYLALVDLTAAAPTPVRVQIAADLLAPPAAEEVLLSPDGRYAIVRQFGSNELVVVDLTTQSVERIDVGDNPTDLDATPDGTQAVAVARGSGQLWIYDLADPFAEPTVIPLPEGEVFGSVIMSPDGSQALLYSTASGVARYASWDRTTNDIAVHALVKPVSGMRVSPSGDTALVFHDKSANTDVDSDSPFYNEWALTLVDLDDFFANPLRLPNRPSSFAATEDGSTGFFIMETEPYLEVIDFDSLLYTEVALKSAPVHLGVLPETDTAYVSQEHELGRISFYDVALDTLQTITGFELNAGIESN